MQTKKLYLSAVNAGDLYQNLNRIDPVAAGKTSTSNSVALTNGTSATFAQTPAFCQPFVLSAGSPVAVTNYVSILSGSMPASPAIRAMLKQGTNAATATTFLTLTNAAYSGGTLGWSGTLSTNVTIGAGETTFLVVTSAQSGVSFTIQYNSASKPSAISLPTTTVISLDQLGLYDAPYPGGNLVTNAVNGQTVYIRATASDPFGAYRRDEDQPGTCWTQAAMPSRPISPAHISWPAMPAPAPTNIPGSPRTGRVPTASWPPLTKARRASPTRCMAAFQVHYPAGGTPSTTTFINSSGNPTNSYATNETVCVRVQDANMNQNPAAVETVSVVITTTSGDSETVTLTETGTNTGVFTGCITANTNAAVPGQWRAQRARRRGSDRHLHRSALSRLTFPVTTPSSACRPGRSRSSACSRRWSARPTAPCCWASTVQFNIEVANPGSVTVTNVTLTDTFPSTRLQFVSATIPPDSTTPAGTLTWNNLGPLVPGPTSSSAPSSPRRWRAR